MISLPLVRYVLTAALRDRLIVTLGLMLILSGCLSLFLGSAAVTEQHSFAVVFGSGSLRLLGIIGIVLFVAFYMRRSFENKEVEFLLSRPLSRRCFVFSHAAAFVLLASVVALFVTLAVVIMGRPDFSGLVIWSFSLMVEYAIMAIATLFFSSVLSSAAGSALAALGLYVLCRIIGTVFGIASATEEGWFYLIAGKIVEVIGIVIPRLDLIGQTSWLVYGRSVSVLDFSTQAGAFSIKAMNMVGIAGFISLQGIVFSGLLLAATLFDFRRKRF